MRKAAYSLLVFVITVAFSSPGWSEEKAGLFDRSYIHGSLAFTTDYVFRGVSQTDGDPAVQGSFEYSHPTGFYLGLWGSNVDSSVSDGNLEI
ncbi:MAG: hypothetical protein JRJ29_14920, partial [Deltaproteobacteria bacterium]|nr:hypothetical protein [Deltaproteobacteria bacterium]